MVGAIRFDCKNCENHHFRELQTGLLARENVFHVIQIARPVRQCFECPNLSDKEKNKRCTRFDSEIKEISSKFDCLFKGFSEHKYILKSNSSWQWCAKSRSQYIREDQYDLLWIAKLEHMAEADGGDSAVKNLKQKQIEPPKEVRFDVNCFAGKLKNKCNPNEESNRIQNMKDQIRAVAEAEDRRIEEKGFSLKGIFTKFENPQFMNVKELDKLVFVKL